MQSYVINLTEHAIEQAKKRMGLSVSTLLKLANRALEKGDLEDQLDGTTKYRHGEKCFIFSGNKLVTVYEMKMKSPYTVLYKKGKRKVLQNTMKYKP